MPPARPVYSSNFNRKRVIVANENENTPAGEGKVAGENRSGGENRGPRGPRGGGQRGGFGGPGGENRGPGGQGGNRAGGRGGRGRPDRDRAGATSEDGKELAEKIIFINRSSKVVKGGRRFSFSALVVTGDKEGRVGLGLGKASEVADCIRKGSESAKRNLSKIAIDGATIPHEVLSVYDGARVLLRPASPGTGIIAGKTVRAVVESAGIKDLLSKSLGSKNAANVAKATLQALSQLRLRHDIYKDRGLAVRDTNASPEGEGAVAETAATEA